MLDSIDLDAEEQALRDEVRSWIEAFTPAELRGSTYDDVRLHGSEEQRQALARYTNDAAAAGLVCAGWPEQYGGRGLTVRQLAILTVEFARAGVPRPTRVAGETLVGPAVIAHGTEEQRRTFLPPIVSGEHVYCQGFSEPDAGSDLAGLRTTGLVDGDEVLISGQKVWTSGADRATHIFILCRTDPTAPKHRGISYVLVPMRHPDGTANGIEIRPIRQITGQARFFETFLDAARAPLDNVIGGLHEGWRTAMTTLTNERGGRAASQYLELAGQESKLLDATDGGRRTVDRDRLTRLHIEMEILRLNTLRTLVGDPDDAARVAALHKAMWSEHLQRAAAAAVDLLGPAAIAHEPDDERSAHWADYFLQSRCHSIWGGTAEIQRNIIGERLLGLPKEAQL